MPGGIGRTRLLDQATRELRAAGREVVWVPASELPFGSLSTALGLVGTAPERLREVIRDRLRAGTVVVVDPPERVDRWTVEMLRREPGPILGLGPEVPLSPLTELEQRELFAGPDKVLHLAEDGARELHRRSRGHPGRMVAVLVEWISTGLARIDGDRILLDPGAPARLADLPLRAGVARIGALPDEDPLRCLLTWIALADGDADAGLLARMSGRPRWEIDLLRV